VFVSRETEADGLGSDESRGKSRLKRTPKGPVATQGAKRYEILVLEEGGQGALIGLPSIRGSVHTHIRRPVTGMLRT